MPANAPYQRLGPIEPARAERGTRLTRWGEAGFTLIEVVIALVVLLGATVATASLVSTSLKVSSNSRYKQVATDIASSVLDCSVQQGGAALLEELQTVGEWSTPPAACGGGSIKKGGVAYYVEQEIAPGAGGCAAPQAGVANELVVTELVTWGGGTSGTWWTGSTETNKLVQETSYAAVPGTALNSSLGNILVQVTDDATNGQSQVLVVATYNGTPPATENSTTIGNGCVLFPNVTPGSWTITGTRTGWLDPNEHTSASSTQNVPAGLTTAVSLKLAQEAAITPNYTLSAGNLPTNNANGNSLASSLPLSLYNSKLTTNPYVTGQPSAPPAEVYPYTSSSPSYTVVAGSCGTDSTPDTGGASTDGYAVNVTDGSSATVPIPLTPVVVAVASGGASVAGASVTAQAASSSGQVPDPACSSTYPMPTLNLGTTCTGGTCLVNYVRPNSQAEPDVGQALLVSFVRTRAGSNTTSDDRAGLDSAVLTTTHTVHSPHPSKSLKGGRSVAAIATSVSTATRSASTSGDSGSTKSAATRRTGSSSRLRLADAKPSLSSRTSVSHPRLVQSTRKTQVAPRWGSPQNTTTTVTSSQNPSTSGQSVTFTATISPDDGGGTVGFTSNGTAISGCTSQSITNTGPVWNPTYQATCTTSALPAGSDYIVATYSGDSGYNSSSNSSTTLVDSSGNGNTGSAQGGVTLGSSGPTTLGATTNAIALDGSTGWVQTTKSYNNPQTFSIVAWFKTSTTSGGTIIGFSNAQSNSGQSDWDREIWMDNSGKLVWGTYNGSSTQEITSPSAYNDGNWHMVVANIASSGSTKGMYLYVDGSLVASKTSYTTAENYTGYWHLGWDSESGWADAPTSSYLQGSLSEVAVIPTQLSSAQISTLYGETSTSAFASYVGGLSPTSYWALQDTSGYLQTVNEASTTTSLSSSVNPSSSGQAVTFTATVSPSDGGGSVAFYSNGSSISGCTAQSLTKVGSNYQATCTTSSLASGSDTITATYSGDGNYSGSTSSNFTQTVKTATTTTLSSSVNPSSAGQAVTFTATVSPTDGGGSVAFYSNGSSISGCTAQSLTKVGSNYQATCTTSSLAGGSDTITATYSGDTNYSTSTSSNFNQTVNLVSTTTTLSSSANPSVYGQSVTFTATVSPDDGGGSVAFKANGLSITGCTAQSLVNNSGSYQATCSVSSLAVASNTITATYSGDTTYSSSTSSNFTQTVNKASTTTSVTSSANPNLAGLSVTFTATVSVVAPGAGSPTGSVTFYDNGTSIGSGTLSGGVATLTTSTLPTGTDSITATYGGDSNFNGSTSSALSQQINAVTSGTASGLPYGIFEITATYGSKTGSVVVSISKANGITIDSGTAYLIGGVLIIPVS